MKVNYNSGCIQIGGDWVPWHLDDSQSTGGVWLWNRDDDDTKVNIDCDEVSKGKVVTNRPKEEL